MENHIRWDTVPRDLYGYCIGDYLNPTVVFLDTLALFVMNIESGTRDDSQWLLSIGQREGVKVLFLATATIWRTAIWRGSWLNYETFYNSGQIFNVSKFNGYSRWIKWLIELSDSTIEVRSTKIYYPKARSINNSTNLLWVTSISLSLMIIMPRLGVSSSPLDGPLSSSASVVPPQLENKSILP